MPKLEQIQRQKRRRKIEDVSKFPETNATHHAQGGNPDDVNEILERIDQDLKECVVRELGAASIESSS